MQFQESNFWKSCCSGRLNSCDDPGHSWAQGSVFRTQVVMEEGTPLISGCPGSVKHGEISEIDKKPYDLHDLLWRL